MSISTSEWTRIAKNTYALKVGGSTLVRYRYKGDFTLIVVPDVTPVSVPVFDVASDASEGDFVFDNPTTVVNIESVKNLSLGV